MNSLLRTPRFACRLFALAIPLVYAVPTHGQARFQGLGFLQGHTFSSVLDVSADGAVVVGVSSPSGDRSRAFRWSRSGGMAGLPSLPGIPDSIAEGVSADGSVVVGQTRYDIHALRWSQTDGLLDLGPGNAYDVSADGSAIAGELDRQAVLWTDSGLLELGFLTGTDKSATGYDGLSSNGAVVVGRSYSYGGRSEAFRWSEVGGMMGLGDLPAGEFLSGAESTSSDGSVVVGYGVSRFGQEAFRWTEAGGMVGLGDLPGGGFSSRASDVSGDGSIVVGSSVSGFGGEAFMWNETRGMRRLLDVLTKDHRLDLEGWTLRSANAISADGRIIVGDGRNPSSQEEAWIATLPEPRNTWLSDSNGNWSVPGNWTISIPNAAGAEAVFDALGSAARTVTVDAPITVGRVDFESANTYTITGNHTLTLDAVSGDAKIRVTSGSHVISAPLRLADNTLVAVDPIASNLSITGELGSSGVSLTKTSAGTLTVKNVRAAALAVNGGTLALQANGGTSTLAGLSIAGDGTPTAKLDLSNNSAIIDYTNSNPLATLRSQLLAGRGGRGPGAIWTGQGITSSAAAAANAADPESRSIGYADNSALPLGPYASFQGQPVDDTSLLIAFTRTGDANLDGIVNDDDVTIVGATYAPGVLQPSWALGDFDYNGFVDDDDVTLLGVFYDPSALPLLAPAGLSAVNIAAVPEPRSWLLLALGIVALLLVPKGRRCWSAGSRTCESFRVRRQSAARQHPPLKCEAGEEQQNMAQ